MIQKRRVYKLTAILFGVLVSTQLWAANIPQKLLDTPITLTTGEVVTLAQYQNKQPVYLKFWASWCQPCLKEMPHFEHVQKQYGDKIKVIGINLGLNDDLEAVKTVQKKFNLTMPLAFDKDGNLAQSFRLLATPYHLLFDKQMNLIHVGNKASAALDNKLGLISQQKSIDLLNPQAIAKTGRDIPIELNDGNIHGLFFTSAWCDWYLESSRPKVSQHCISYQKNINALYKKYPEVKWQGILTRLWTGEKELAKYKLKYKIQHPLAIDFSNQLFYKFNVKDLGTLLFVKDGKILYKTSSKSLADIKKQLADLVNK